MTGITLPTDQPQGNTLHTAQKQTKHKNLLGDHTYEHARAKITMAPKEYEPALESIRHDDAILNGQLEVINQRRARHYRPQPYRHRSQYNGGLVGKTSRAFLGRPTGDKKQIPPHHPPSVYRGGTHHRPSGLYGWKGTASGTRIRR